MHSLGMEIHSSLVTSGRQSHETWGFFAQPTPEWAHCTDRHTADRWLQEQGTRELQLLCLGLSWSQSQISHMEGQLWTLRADVPVPPWLISPWELG